MTREQMQLNAEMSTQMTERFNVAGALLVKLFGRPDEEAAAFSGRSGRVRDIGITHRDEQPHLLHRAHARRGARHRARLRRRRQPRHRRARITVGTLLALAALLGRLYGPLTALSNVRVDVMTALVSFERVFEVLDLAPMVEDAATPRRSRPGRRTIEFDDVRFRYPSADEVSLASLESVARPDSAPVRDDVLRDVTFTRASRARWSRSSARPAPARRRSPRSCRGSTTSPTARSGSTASTCATSRRSRCTRLVGVVTQDAHMFHDTIRANLLYARPDATDERAARARCATPRSSTSSRTLPDGLDTVVGDRGYRLSGGEKQRMAIARLLLKAPDVVVLDEATAHLDSESEVAVQRALATALEGRTSLVIAHRLSTIRDADQILVVEDGRIASRAATTSCSPPAASTPTSTAPSSPRRRTSPPACS